MDCGPFSLVIFLPIATCIGWNLYCTCRPPLLGCRRGHSWGCLVSCRTSGSYPDFGRVIHWRCCGICRQCLGRPSVVQVSYSKLDRVLDLQRACCMAYLSGAMEDAGAKEFALQVAYKKVNQTWGNILLKGILERTLWFV